MVNNATDIYYSSERPKENIKIPLWKLVDGNYQFPKEDNAIHHNGYIFEIEAGSFVGDLGAGPGGSDIYSYTLPYAYSQSLYRCYRQSTLAQLTNVTSFSGVNQCLITDASVLQICITHLDPMFDVYFSPSDYTRIGHGETWSLGSCSFGELTIGAEYNSKPAYGYIATNDLTKNDLGDIISPYKATDWNDYPFANHSPAVMATMRCAYTSGLVGLYRSMGLSHSRFVKLSTTLEEVSLSQVEMESMEFDFRSNQNGAYLRIKNNNAFDVFIYSIEIWGLWAVRQSTTDKFGGAVMAAKYIENDTTNQQNKVDTTNNYIKNSEQATDVAAYFYEILCKNASDIGNTNIGPIDYYEIGDQLAVTAADLSGTTDNYIVIGKTKSKDGTVLQLRKKS